MYLTAFSGFLLKDSKRWIKILRVMKIIVFIMLAICLQASADGYSQKITLSEKNASLGKIFRSIYRQCNLQFIYNDEALKGTNRVTIKVKEAPLSEVLSICFQDQPITYKIDHDAIVVIAKPQNEGGKSDRSERPKGIH